MVPGRVSWESRHGDIQELAAGGEDLEECEESKLADSFRAERTCKSSGSCSTALPEEDVVGGDDPSKRADMASATDWALGKAVDFVCLERALEKFPFPVGE